MKEILDVVTGISNRWADVYAAADWFKYRSDIISHVTFFLIFVMLFRLIYRIIKYAIDRGVF